MTGLTAKGNLVVIIGSVLAVVALFLWASGDRAEEASAFPGLTVGIDADPTTTTDTNADGVYDSVDLGTFEACRDVTNGQQFTIEIFVLDGVNLIGFDADFIYDGSVVNVIGSETTQLFLDSPSNSTVSNFSQNGPEPSGAYSGMLQVNGIDDDADTLIDEDPINGINDDADAQTDEDAGADKDGFYEAAGLDTANVGASGSGVLALLTLKAIAPGVSTASLNIDPGSTRGVTLTDTAEPPNNHPGDTNSDGLYDGPFINSTSTIAVDQPDLNSDGVSDVCDPDDDGDGVPDTSDNCPTDSNTDQADLDADTLGDVCDSDADGDGYHNETPRGADDLDAGSTPEVCDLIDNDGDTDIDEGWGEPPTPFTDTCTTANVDTDADGYTDPNEHFMSSDSTGACPTTTLHHAWPPDVNNNQTVNVLDIGVFRPAFFTEFGVDSTYDKRLDMNGDTKINILDIGSIRPFFLASCVP